jgi:hypothetical protein
MLKPQPVPVVTCPGCKCPMQPTGSESLPNGLHRKSYRCDQCGAETERLYKGVETRKSLPR